MSSDLGFLLGGACASGSRLSVVLLTWCCCLFAEVIATGASLVPDMSMGGVCGVYR